jgi:hypothetical protein
MGFELYVEKRPYHVRIYSSLNQLKKGKYLVSFCPNIWSRTTKIKLRLMEIKKIRIEEIPLETN